MTDEKTIKKRKTKAEKSNYDSAWKDVIKNFFGPFLEFFFPSVHDAVDFSREVTFLDKELKEIDPDSVLGDRAADILARVYLKSGVAQYISIHVHIEVQGKPHQNFMERMFIYNYRAFDKKKRKKVPVLSMAVLTDEDVNFRPDKYLVELPGFELRMKIPVAKILDFKREAELRKKVETSSNPMAMVVKAQLKSFEIKGKAGRDRFEVTKELIRECYRKGYSKAFVKQLTRFIEWIIRLPEMYEEEIKVEIKKIEEELKMPYLASFERSAQKRGMERGMEKGMEKGTEKGREERDKEIATRMLRKGMTFEAIHEMTGIDIEKIKKLAAANH